MNVTRRQFLLTGTVAALGVVFQRPMNPFNRYVVANAGRIVAMSNPVGNDWLRNVFFYSGRQWLHARPNGVDDTGEVQVEWYGP